MVEGHTDNIGKEELNIKLSQQRAEAIVSYLTEKGIDPSRLKAKGYGFSKPIADNNTEEGRAMNRRTEIKIIE
jgi:outer membrane protein OmpA-like peptidoglycan-associated protein